MIQKTNSATTIEEYEVMSKVLSAKSNLFCAVNFEGTKITGYIIYNEDEDDCFTIYKYASGKTRLEAWKDALNKIGTEMLAKLESYAE